MDYLERNPRDPARENQFSAASGADRNARSMRGIPETPNGSRGPDPLMNYTLRPEDMMTVKKLGEGSAGTVSKVKHVPTGFVMARKVCNSFSCPWSIAPSLFCLVSPHPQPLLASSLSSSSPLLWLQGKVCLLLLLFWLLELTPLFSSFSPCLPPLPFLWSVRLFLILL